MIDVLVRLQQFVVLGSQSVLKGLNFVLTNQAEPTKCQCLASVGGNIRDCYGAFLSQDPGVGRVSILFLLVS